MRFALPGDFIGFQVNSQGKIGHSAQALTNGILCGFSRKKLSDMVKKNANISESLIVIISRDMSLCQQHFFGMTQKTAIESISFLLLELYHRVKNKSLINNNLPTNNSIYFPLTQEDIGDATGVSKIHTNRILRQLRDQKIVHCYKKRLTILDEAALSDIAQFDINLIKNPKVL